MNLNPVLSWKASPNLSIAAGLNVIRTEADLRRKINLAAAGMSDGNQITTMAAVTISAFYTS